jgi:hypothetical protein
MTIKSVVPAIDSEGRRGYRITYTNGTTEFQSLYSLGL